MQEQPQHFCGLRLKLHSLVVATQLTGRRTNVNRPKRSDASEPAIYFFGGWLAM